ncbi:Asp-tRNA(Asn)/Glu-tRNA(Gln) amidotransferase subunit GatA [Candidatus Woesearchaeota archaeon]|nr:Asp-tRNA(Asn)/Glu-tRNA(Gln) amidotransferase subunit GatA [Candidatus Woesearchaeota archaeon]
MDISEYINKVKSNEIDIIEHTKKVIQECRKINKEYNYFNVISEELALEQAKELKKRIKKKDTKGNLFGVHVSVKDCVCVKDVESRAGSKILFGYRPVFDATVIQKAKEQGAIIIGKTSQDAFGYGSFNVNVGLDFKIPKNPFDKERATGGSSGGAAGITQKLDLPHIAISESTGGSIAAPASYCGVIGLCPTYGRVSRYGLMDYANSLDKIGVMSKNIEDCAVLLHVIAGHDNKDSTSLEEPVENYPEFVNKKSRLKIGIIKESLAKGIDPEVKDSVLNTIKKLHDNGIKTQEVSLPLVFKYGVQTYYLISLTETSTNLAKFCGMRYGYEEKLEGNFNEYFSKIRSNAFNREAKRRIILGTFARMAGFRDAYYSKAMKVRTLMIQEYKKLFKKFDLLVCPTMPNVAPKFYEIDKLTPMQNFMMDIMTAGPNLAGFPHLSMPCGPEDNLPVGIMFTADHLEEKKLIQIAGIIEKLK